MAGVSTRFPLHMWYSLLAPRRFSFTMVTSGSTLHHVGRRSSFQAVSGSLSSVGRIHIIYINRSWHELPTKVWMSISMVFNKCNVGYCSLHFELLPLVYQKAIELSFAIEKCLCYFTKVYKNYNTKVNCWVVYLTKVTIVGNHHGEVECVDVPKEMLI